MSTATTLPAAPAAVRSGSSDADTHLLPSAHLPVEFPAGLVGMPDCRSFVLSRAAAPGTFWLESVDCRGLAFLLVDPFPFFDEYTIDLDAEQLPDLATGDPAGVALLAIVTLPAEPDGTCSANLQAPLAIDLHTGRAKQLVLSRSDFGVRCPLRWDLAA